MSQLLINIIGGLIVIIIAAVFGIGGTTRVVVHGTRTGKTGKWIIIISVLMILGGAALLGKEAPPGGGLSFNEPGTLLMEYGVLFL
jgi:hypothetical protein